MATQPEYSAAANAVLKVLDNYVNEFVPDTFGYRQKALAAMPAVAGACAKAGIDAVDTLRTSHQSSKGQSS